MPAILQIDQAGLPAGSPGFSRSDGLATGALVTVSSLGSGLTHTVRLLAVPLADTTALASLAPAGPTVWTFSPTPAAPGTYRIELVVDEGLPTEARTSHTFAVRTPFAGLRIPAYNEKADPNASAIDFGGNRVALSETNEPTVQYPLGEPFGWWRALVETMGVVETLVAGGGGGGGKQSNRIIVGSVTAGDTLAICDLLDPGDGSAIHAALAAAAGGPFDVWLRPGFYGNNGTTYNVPPGVTLQGVNASSVFLASDSVNRQAFALNTDSVIRGFSLFVPPAAPGAFGQRVVIVAGGRMEGVFLLASGLNPLSPDETLLGLVQGVGTSAMAAVRNCYIEGTQMLPGGLHQCRGIEIAGGQSVQVFRNRVVNCDDGIWLSNAGGDHTVMGCSVSGAVRTGIVVSGSSLCRVLGNSVEVNAGVWPGTSLGISVSGVAGGNLITNNAISTDVLGVGVRLDSAVNHYSGTNNVSSNVIENGGGSAIELTATEAGSTVVANNTRGGSVVDFGVGNVVALNNPYVTP